MAGAPVTLIEVGVKPKAVRVGGVVSWVEVTVRLVGNPIAFKSAVASTKVLPAASLAKTEPTVQTPASLNLGKVRVTESVTVAPGVKLLLAA